MPIPALLFAMILGLLAPDARAQVTIENVLVGFTSATFTGNGALALTAACQAQFPNTRICTSEEVTNSRRIPSGLSGTAWVRPRIILLGSNGTPVDASGVGVLYSLCDEYGSLNLLVTTATGAISGDANCVTEQHAVACCGRPIEPANGDLDLDGMATIRDDAVLRRMLAGLPVPAP